jgi:Polymer-forming cytoskeletal
LELLESALHGLGLARPTANRSVVCYHCGHRFEVAPKASVLTCSGCYRRVNVQDVRLTREVNTEAIQTAGRIWIGPRARVIAGVIEGGAGVDIEGIVQGEVRSGHRVTIGPAAWFRGRCSTPVLHVSPGAAVEGAGFHVGIPREHNPAVGNKGGVPERASGPSAGRGVFV